MLEKNVDIDNNSVQLEKNPTKHSKPDTHTHSQNQGNMLCSVCLHKVMYQTFNTETLKRILLSPWVTGWHVHLSVCLKEPKQIFESPSFDGYPDSLNSTRKQTDAIFPKSYFKNLNQQHRQSKSLRKKTQFLSLWIQCSSHNCERVFLKYRLLDIVNFVTVYHILIFWRNTASPY